MDSHDTTVSKSPEKSRTQVTPTPQTQSETPTPLPDSTPASHPTSSPNQVPSTTSPQHTTENVRKSTESVRKSATNPIPTSHPPPTNPPLETQPQTKPPLTASLPPPAFPKKAEILEFDLGAPKAPGAPRTAVQERLEKYAEERKVAALSRPSTANLERRLADAEERRKVSKKHTYAHIHRSFFSQTTTN